MGFLRQLLAAALARPIVTGLTAISLVLGAVNYFLWQQRHGVAFRHDELVQRGTEVAKALTEQARTKADLTTLEEALTQIDRNVISEGEMEVNLGYFYKMERLSRVRLSQLNQLSATGSADGGSFRAIPFSMRVNGTYAEVMNFVHQLETGPRLARVRTYSFVRPLESKERTLDLDLTVELLSRP